MIIIRRSYFARTFISACLLLLAAQATSAKTYNFNGPGSWTDPALWSPSYPGTTINSGDTVNINDGSDCAIALGTAVSINPGATLEINSKGYLTNAGSLFVGGTLVLNGSLSNSGGLLTIRGPLNNYDSLTGSGRLAISAEGSAQLLNNGSVSNGGSPVPSATTSGQKRLLFIRATFPDDPTGPLPTNGDLNQSASITNTDFLIASYSLFSLNWTSGPTLMLPHTIAYYNVQPGRTTSVLADAHALAASLGYDYTNYDIDIVYVPQFYGVFSAYVGSNVGRDAYSWLEPANILNQGYGVEGFVDDFYFPMAARADAWYSHDSTVFGTNGSVVPNGDPYDTYGTEQTGVNYSIYHKNEVGWLPSTYILPVTASGTYRIYAHDTETSITNGRYYGLTVAGYQGRTYWIEYRQNPLIGFSGLLINWGGLRLLDMTPGSAGGFLDAPLLIGQTFTDPNGVRINPIVTGGTTPQFVDIAVTIAGGPQPTPTPTPTVTPTPTPTPNPTPIPAPVLLVDANTNRAIALDSVLFTAEPFSLVSQSNFSADQRPRVMLFARNVHLSQNETFSVVTARAVDSGRNVYTLAVEYVGIVPDFDGLATVIVKLPDNLTFNGDVSVSISLRGVPSNSVALAIRAP